MNSNARTIRVASIDDHDIMRGGIRFVLMAFDDIELVSDSRRGEDAVKICQEFEPDVVLVDMMMQGFDGIETTTAIKQSFPNVQVVILTSFHDAGLVRRAIKAGAVGYVLKDADKEELASAIRAASVGKTTISSEVANALAEEKAPPDDAIEITERERDVLQLLVKGMSNKEIAKQLHRSPFTVRHHVSRLIQRLGAANRAEVAAIAVERGLI